MKRVQEIKELKIEVNRSCPLHCLHCSSNGLLNASEQLEPHRVSELIREFDYLGGKKVCISGGEPLCYEGLPVIIDACSTHDIQTSVYTTGIISNDGSLGSITDDTITFLLKNKVRMVVSLHGAYAKTHDELTTVPGSFEATTAVMQRARRAGIAVEAHIVPTALNFEELPLMIKALVDLDIYKASWLRLVPQGRGLLNWNKLRLQKEQFGKLSMILSEIKQNYSTIELRTGAPFNVLCPENPVNCDAGLSVLTIRPDGFVAPCDAFKRYKGQGNFSNIIDYSLPEVWQKSPLLNAVRRMHEDKLSSSCASCSLFSRCESGCLAQQVISTGELKHGKDPECRLADENVREYEIERILVR